MGVEPASTSRVEIHPNHWAISPALWGLATLISIVETPVSTLHSAQEFCPPHCSLLLLLLLLLYLLHLEVKLWTWCWMWITPGDTHIHYYKILILVNIRIQSYHHFFQNVKTCTQESSGCLMIHGRCRASWLGVSQKVSEAAHRTKDAKPQCWKVRCGGQSTEERVLHTRLSLPVTVTFWIRIEPVQFPPFNRNDRHGLYLPWWG